MSKYNVGDLVVVGPNVYDDEETMTQYGGFTGKQGIVKNVDELDHPIGGEAVAYDITIPEIDERAWPFYADEIVGLA